MRGKTRLGVVKYLLPVVVMALAEVGIAPSTLGAATNEFPDPDGYASDPARPVSLLVRIDISEGMVRLPQSMDITGMRPGEWVDIIIPRWQLSAIERTGAEFTVLQWDVGAYLESVAGSYHTLTEIEGILQDIAAAYPGITSLYSIGTSYQDRQVWCLEITDNPGVDEGEPGVLFMGLHHAREWPTVEVCLNIADRLTSLYGSDPEITDVVDNRRLWLITVMNPDGYYYSHDQGHDWRKNRHYLPEFGTWGIDLNRNYGGSSNGDIWGAWGSIGYGSVTHSPDYETYCGPSANSENETRIVENLFQANDISAAITWHTYSELVLWPWGYSTGVQVPDDNYISSVGQQIASRIQRQGGGSYTPQQSSQLYPTTGDATDWLYGYTHYVLGKTCFAYTVEACNEFQPPQSQLDQIVAENFDGALYLLQEAENIRNTVVPRVVPPVIDGMNLDFDGDYQVSWRVRNPESGPDFFELDELTGLSLLTEDVESGTDLWNLDGFTRTTSRYHSSSHSFRSRQSDYDVSAITTVDPVPVTAGMALSFWCWYDIEENWDYAFVEVSRDGRSFDILDTFTGSSGGWDYRVYGLDAYVDESIFVRFRYTTDALYSYEGFYVDDIAPVADFGTVTTLSSSIPDTFFQVTGRANGDYYYRVKGHNAARGWGDFSTLEKMEVTEDIVGPVIHFDNLNSWP